MDKKRGFTLIEVMVATAMLLLTTGALLDAFVKSSELIEMDRPQLVALNAVQAKLEEIANSDLSQIMNYQNHTFPVTGLSPPLGSATAGAVSVSQIVGTTDLFDVTVTVIWEQRGRIQSRSIRTTLVRR